MLTETVRPIERSAFSSRDPEATTEFFRTMYVGNRTSFAQVAPESGFDADFAGAGALRADRLRGALTMSITADSLGYVLFGQLQRGRWTLQSAGREIQLGPGDSVLYPIESPFQLQAQDFDFRVACLSLTRMRAFAASQAGFDVQDLRFTSMVPVSSAMANYFNRTLAMIHREMTNPDPTSSLILEQLVQVAAAAVLTTFPNSTMTADYVSPTGGLQPAAVRRGKQFVEEHAGEPLTLADIADAAGTNGRALQAAFRRNLNTTPMTYLRQVRLDGAHRDLQNADPAAGPTVAVVAARWGFAHRAQFDRAYRAQYGASPDDTLRADGSPAAT